MQIKQKDDTISSTSFLTFWLKKNVMYDWERKVTLSVRGHTDPPPGELFITAWWGWTFHLVNGSMCLQHAGEILSMHTQEHMHVRAYPAPFACSEEKLSVQQTHSGCPSQEANKQTVVYAWTGALCRREEWNRPLWTQAPFSRIESSHKTYWPAQTWSCGGILETMLTQGSKTF